MSILPHNPAVVKRSQSPIPWVFWISRGRNRNCCPADTDKGVLETSQGDWSGNENLGCWHLEGHEYWEGNCSGLGWFAFEQGPCWCNCVEVESAEISSDQCQIHLKITG